VIGLRVAFISQRLKNNFVMIINATSGAIFARFSLFIFTQQKLIYFEVRFWSPYNPHRDVQPGSASGAPLLLFP
jgi:hypothetical protein